MHRNGTEFLETMELREFICINKHCDLELYEFQIKSTQMGKTIIFFNILDKLSAYKKKHS